MGNTIAKNNQASSELDQEYRLKLNRIEQEMSHVIIGQERMIQSMICTLIARGHILLEGVPGLAKSLTVNTFSQTIGGDFNRIQFTPDKLPSDITGTTIYQENTGEFTFHEGPVFCNILLADEINRASPKVQSALLEAMQEKAISVDRDHYPLPELFMVLATQNPVEQLGTYPLSEAQLDRFMTKVDLTYPGKACEGELLRKKSTNFDELRKAVPRILTTEEVVRIQDHVKDRVTLAEPVIAYILEICRKTRPEHAHGNKVIQTYVSVGVSPRAGEHMITFCKAFAFLHGRSFVTFEDVDICAGFVLGHRLILSDTAILEGVKGPDVLSEIIRSISPYQMLKPGCRC